jgi:murein DD-endopeptidase MepM/ murein hydrolase activator NlpD
VSFVGALTVSALVAPPDGATARTPGGCSTTYQVVRGDGWWGVANKVKAPLASLLAANNAQVATPLYPGMLLCVPASGATPPAPPATSTPAVCAVSYQVVAGDGWLKVASRSSVDVRLLLSANNATLKTMLFPGRVLCVPGQVPATTVPPLPGTTLPEISPSPSTVPAACAVPYQVVAGDGWWLIASRSKVSLSSLLAANNATVRTALFAGRTVCLPAGTQVPTPSTSTTVPAPAPVPQIVFPVQGPCWFADTWLAPRGGGRRHEGVDIIASRAGFVYAAVSGTLSKQALDRPGSLAGNAWWLTSADGSYFFYAHLLAFAPGLAVGSTVEAGQVIGWVGSSGNASGPHLHFEIHPAGGPAVNPTPAVAAVNGCRSTVPPTQPGGAAPPSLPPLATPVVSTTASTTTSPAG